MRRTVRVERRLDAAPEGVFAMVTDHARYDRFAGIRRSELFRPGEPSPNGVGAVRWVWIGPLRFEEEVTAYEAPRRLDYVIRRVRPLPFRHAGGSIRLEPDGAGTRAVWTSSFEIPIPLLGRLLDRIFERQLDRGFGRVLERSAALSRDGLGGS
jgi:uncharacterized protein YndB with AHSA1/START domain